MRDKVKFGLPNTLFFFRILIIYRWKRFVDDGLLRHRIIVISVMKEKRTEKIILSNASAVIIYQNSTKRKSKIKQKAVTFRVLFSTYRCYN